MMHAAIDAASTPASFIRRASVRGPKPASTNTRVSPLSRSTALPLLPLPNTHTFIRYLIQGPARLVRRRELSPRAFAQLDVPPCHDALGDAEKLLQLKGIIRCAAPPRERGNDFRLHLAAEHARARSEHGPGRQRRADSRLRVITEERTKELQARLSLAARRPELDGAVRVLEVAGDGARADVDPPSEVRMSDEAVVRLVRVP